MVILAGPYRKGSMNGNTQKWLIGILSTIAIGLSSALYLDIKSDIQSMDAKIEQIQVQYYRIAVIGAQLDAVESQLEELLSR